MGPDIINKFLFNECKERRTWEQIGTESPVKFKTGGLGKISGATRKQWDVWACWKDHPCLLKLSDAVDGDYMCYVYNELEKTWHAWGIKRDVEREASCPAANFR